MSPKNTKEVHAFIGIVNYYRKMLARRSHLLHPLTTLTSNKVKFKWTDLEQKALDDINCAITQYTLLAYMNLNKCFDIHLYDINYQLRAVISQDGKPIDFYRRKLTGPKTRYTEREK